MDRLSSLDLSFLAMETADTPMHLGAVLIFRPAAAGRDRDEPGGVLAARLAEVLAARAAGVPRLRQRLSGGGLGLGGPGWVEDAGFDAADHVRLSRLPAPGGRDELALQVAESLAVPLDRDRPLWELHVLAGMADGSVAVLAKIHHALADGLRAVVLGMALFDQPDTTGPQQPVPAASAADASAAESSNAQTSRAGLAARLAGAAAGLTGPARAMLNPRLVGGGLARYGGQARDVAVIGASIVGAVARPAPACLTLNPAAARRYAALTAAADGPARRFAMLSLDLDAVRTVGKSHGGTVNDVLLTVLAGGLRSWLAERGHRQPRPLRALVPVRGPTPIRAVTGCRGIWSSCRSMTPTRWRG